MDKKVLAGAAVLGAAGFWFYVKPGYLDSKPPVIYTAEDLAAAPKPTVQLQERVLNLKAPPTAPNYVKVVIALEFADPQHKYVGLSGHALTAKNEEFQAHVEPELPKIWDIITNVIGSKSIAEVSTPEGRERLKQELVAQFNDHLHGKEVVENVYFVTFITQ